MTTDTAGNRRTAVRLRKAPLLRWALEIDGIGSALNGLAYVVAAGWIGEQLGMPTALLVPVGVVLVGYGAALVLVSLRTTLNAAAVKTVIALNTIWVIDSVVVAYSGWYELTGAGVAWILAQAGLVAAFAATQAAGLRRAVHG